jgi:hypothetical protein
MTKQWITSRRFSVAEVLGTFTTVLLLVATLSLTLYVQHSTDQFRHALASTCRNRISLSELSHRSTVSDEILYGRFLAALEGINPTPQNRASVNQEIAAVRQAYNAKRALVNAYTVPICVD